MEIKRKCCVCGVEIRECMGFVLGRDIISQRQDVRELCERCTWSVSGSVAIYNKNNDIAIVSD